MSRRTTLETPAGTIEGLLTAEGVLQFHAIPYAQSPVGDLRWEAPIPARWEGTLDATRPGPISPQRPSRLRRAMGNFSAAQSEDCLSLTVWAPAPSQRPRPVVVWLHGGAWQSGAGAIDWYDGQRLALQGDVVVVSPNYRLGPFGWLRLPGQPANLGLLDQELAVDWVVDNIAAFGGDPARITVMGQSAGAASVACMLARAPRFNRAIMQSAGLGRIFRSASEADAIAQAVLEAAGVTTVAAARQLPVEALLAAQESPRVAACLAAEGTGRSVFAPVCDGSVLPLDIGPAFQAAAGRADVLIGATAHEMAAFPGYALDAASDRVGEQVFGAPSKAWAAQAAAAGRAAWVYRFDYAPNPTFGACHCIELPFVFGTRERFADAPMLQGASQPDTDRLTAEVQQAWLGFICGGTPGWSPSPAVHVFR
jgi:para-nitrobenzyl esterase